MLSFRNQNRREFLKVGSLGGISLPTLLGLQAQGAEAGRSFTTGKSVIFLMMHGGPSQYETFDPKMGNPSNNRSATGEISTQVPGLTFGSTFPRLAQRADKLAIVKSYVTGSAAHDIKPIVSRDSMGANVGSLYSRMVGPLRPNGLPSNCLLGPDAVDPTQPGPFNRFGNFASTGPLGASFSPFTPGAGGQMQQNMTLNIPSDRVDDRRSLVAQIDRLRRQVDVNPELYATDRLQEQAFDVIFKGIGSAFSLANEDQRLIARYDTSPYVRPSAWAHKTNKNRFTANARSLGKLLLLARRLCELGCGFVTVTTDFVWDMHANKDNLSMVEGMELVGRPFDHAVSAFIDDLEARGLSDKILLVATGEMGRTPNIDGGGGRNHWGKIAPLLLYGGGMTHGQVIGHSSRDGGEPGSEAMTNRHLIGAIMNTLFNVGELRINPRSPADVFRYIIDSPTIPGLL